MLARVTLALFALINIGRGGVHAFAADGGAHSIAGLDLGAASVTIVALFATIGLMQLALGLFEAWVAWRMPALVLPVLALQTLQTALGVIHLHFYRPLPVQVPGAQFNSALLGLLVLLWIVIGLDAQRR